MVANPDWRVCPARHWRRGQYVGPTLFTILKQVICTRTISLEITDPNDITGSIDKGVANIKRILAEVEAED